MSGQEKVYSSFVDFGSNEMKAVRLFSLVSVPSRRLDHASAGRSPRSMPPGRSWLPRLLHTWSERWERRRDLRASIATMDLDRVERDIGVPPGSLRAEAHKPFWRR